MFTLSGGREGTDGQGIRLLVSANGTMQRPHETEKEATPIEALNLD